MPESPLLRIENLAVSFPSRRGDSAGGSKMEARVRAVNQVNFSIYPRQTLAVVGESGCGKSVTAMSILRLVPTPPGRYDGGRILWNSQQKSGPVAKWPSDQGEKIPESSRDAKPVTRDHQSSGPEGPGLKSETRNQKSEIDLLTLSEPEMRKIRGGRIAMIFQEPMTSLNPVYSIGEQMLEAIYLHQKVNAQQARDIATQALVDVGIGDAASRLKEYPHQLSGGMRQRIMIAMALACQPDLLLADEPTTALDVTIQAQILELLRELQLRRQMSILFITHDLGVVAENADVVAVMYAGRVVEYGRVHDIFHRPLHPYTRGLFNSMPVITQHKHRLEAIPGLVPDPTNFPSGCPFHPRCADVKGDAQCTAQDPPLLEVEEQHWVACWHAPGYAQGKKTNPDVAFRREIALAAQV